MDLVLGLASLLVEDGYQQQSTPQLSSFTPRGREKISCSPKTDQKSQALKQLNQPEPITPQERWDPRAQLLIFRLVEVLKNRVAIVLEIVYQNLLKDL